MGFHSAFLKKVASKKLVEDIKSSSTGVMGFEPTTYSLEGCRAIQAALHAHITMDSILDLKSIFKVDYFGEVNFIKTTDKRISCLSTNRILRQQKYSDV